MVGVDPAVPLVGDQIVGEEGDPERRWTTRAAIGRDENRQGLDQSGGNAEQRGALPN
jgi:hypothetical protein